MSLNHLFILSFYIFFISILGIIINRRNIITLIMSIELALLSVNIMFLVASVFIDDHIAHVLVLFILVVAAAESSIGLAILIPFFRLKGTVSTTFAKSLIG